MLNSWKKNFALRDKKNNILTLVLSEKKILYETKNHNPPPPLQVKWSVPNLYYLHHVGFYSYTFSLSKLSLIFRQTTSFNLNGDNKRMSLTFNQCGRLWCFNDNIQTWMSGNCLYCFILYMENIQIKKIVLIYVFVVLWVTCIICQINIILY